MVKSGSGAATHQPSERDQFWLDHEAEQLASGQTVSFSKIALTLRAPDDRFRLELPGGLALEWSRGDVPESVTVLLERLAGQ